MTGRHGILMCAAGLSFAVLAGGCDSGAARRTAWMQDAAAARGPVVAMVAGEEIPAAALERLVADSPGRTKEGLLDELVASIILYSEAESKGYAGGPEMALAHKQLMVQRMLRDKIEDLHRPDAVPAAEVRDYYEAHHDLFNQPELRRIDHLLVMPNPDKTATGEEGKTPTAVADLCDDVARQIREDIRSRHWQNVAAQELTEIKGEWADRLPKSIVLHIDANMVSPREPSGPRTLDRDFLEAAFKLDRGVLSQPVRTAFGTHLIVITEVIAARSTSLEEAEPTIREFIATEARRKAMATLVDSLSHAAAPKLDLEAVGHLESDAGNSPAEPP